MSIRRWATCYLAADAEEGWEGWPESTPGRQSPGGRPVYSGRSHEILFEAPTEGDLLFVVTLDDASPTGAPRKLQMSVNGRPAELEAVRRLPGCCFAPIKRNASKDALLLIDISAPGNEASAAVAIISSVSVMPLHSGRFSRRWTSPFRAIKSLLSRRTPSEWDEADFPYSHFDGLNYLLSHHEARTAVLSRKYTSAYHYYQSAGRHLGHRFPFAIERPPLPGTPFNLVEYYRERRLEVEGAQSNPDHPPELNPCPYHPYDQLPFAGMAMKKLVEDYQFESVLDIGSGEGAHSRLLEKMGKQVTSIDFGRSIYYARTSEHRTTITADYLNYDFGHTFDAIWASHVLEHQPNVNLFLRKIYQDLKDGGVLAITVPPLKHEIVGGHLTVWNAGLLLYNLVMAGFDCREASILQYGYNISVIVRKKPISDHPQLAYDAGDINLLRAYLPPGTREPFNGDIRELNWSITGDREKHTSHFDVPIYHVASMARSGETLLLRILSTHSRIHVVHNLREADTDNEKALFDFLRTYPETSINSSHHLLRHIPLAPGDCIVVKQGVWQHRFPFRGIVLARNPASIFASLLRYDQPQSSEQPPGSWSANQERLTRWLADIAPNALEQFFRLPPLAQFATFYNIRMGHLVDLEHPIVHYENLVSSPAHYVKFILEHLGLPFEAATLESHAVYYSGEKGHGKNDLSLPINTTSLLSYQSMLTEDSFRSLAAKTKSTCDKLGYELVWPEVKITANNRIMRQPEILQKRRS